MAKKGKKYAEALSKIEVGKKISAFGRRNSCQDHRIREI